jgi:hypothetical protein
MVCKWPVILPSCFFVTLLSWDMAGDQGGWFHAIWVPIVGIAMVMILWVWDRVLIFGGLPKIRNWLQNFSFLRDNRHSSTAAPSLQLVHSSLHQSPSFHLPASPESLSGRSEGSCCCCGISSNVNRTSVFFDAPSISNSPLDHG